MVNKEKKYKISGTGQMQQGRNLLASLLQCCRLIFKHRAFKNKERNFQLKKWLNIIKF